MTESSLSPCGRGLGRGGRGFGSNTTRAIRLVRVSTAARCRVLFARGGSLHAAPEKQKVTIAVGGKAALFYLPLTLAERLGYFKDEGLDVQILDFAGGSKALQAMMGGSADVVAGGFDHVIILRARGQKLKAFVLMVATPSLALGVSKERAATYKSPRDLKGMKIGVTAPGSSTNIFVNHLLASAGLSPDDVSIIGVGSGPDCDRGDARRSNRRHRQRRTRHHHAGALGNDQGGRRDHERAGFPGGVRRTCCRRVRCTRRRSSFSAIPRPRRPWRMRSCVRSSG